MDVESQWEIGVTQVALDAFVFHMLVYLMYPVSMANEVNKCIFTTRNEFIAWCILYSTPLEETRNLIEKNHAQMKENPKPHPQRN